MCVRFPAGFQFLPETVRKRSFHPKAGRAISAGSVKENGFIQRVWERLRDNAPSPSPEMARNAESTPCFSSP